MMILVKDGKLDNKQKIKFYKYIGYFKVMNRLGKILEEIGEVGDYIEKKDETKVTECYLKNMEYILDRIDEIIAPAKRKVGINDLLLQVKNQKELVS